MKRHLVLTSLALLLIAQLVALPAGACEKSEKCTLDRSCENTDTGIRCTIKATGDDLEKARKCAGSCIKHCTKDGITVTVEEIEGGLVVTRTATDPEVIKKLQENGDACCHHHSDHEGCPKKAAEGHHGHDCPHHDKQVEKQVEKQASKEAEKPCAKPCAMPCAHHD